jgi:hypothetical protein
MSVEATESRVTELRQREAADEAWQWIVDLKERAKSDSAAAAAELDAIFRNGTPPGDLD